MSFDCLFNPESLAVIGSVSPGKLGAVLLQQIIDGGYQGKMYAVNPKAEGLGSAEGIKSLKCIDHPIQLAVIVSPPSTVISVLEECGCAGVKAAVVITSGFSEIGNRAGEVDLKKIACKYGIRFIGPNCAGIVNTSHNLYPTLELRPTKGAVALVSQSGALGGVVLGWAKQQELGISKFISYGNGADLNEVDFLNYLADDVETKVVALYIESVSNGRAFMKALMACSSKKPVVVIKAGRTSAGKRATASHTGSMAGADAVYDTAIRQSGAIRVTSVEEMLDLCAAFVYAPLPEGNRIIIVTNSGGPGVLAADFAEELGLEITEPSPETQIKLREFLPAHCSLKNPIDLTVEGTEEGYRRTLQTVMNEYDSAVVINVTTSYLDHLSHACGVLTAAKESRKTVLVNFLPELIVADSVRYLKQQNLPNYPSGERATAVLARMAHYGLYRRAVSKEKKPLLNLNVQVEKRELPRSGQMLEPEAMAWLRENHIPVPEFHCAENHEEVVQACADIGYPVVMKVVSPEILHKSDIGGVVVGICDAAAACKAFDQISLVMKDRDFRGVVIYPRVFGAQEVLVGMSRDPQFGPIIAFGLGGIYTEIIHDISLRVAPVDIEEARMMIREIKTFRVLQGARGKPICDLEALAKMLVSFSHIPFLYPQINEIDLNPVFLLPKGLVVGDVRVINTNM